MDNRKEQIQEIIRRIVSRDERGIEMLLTHYGPLMRYIIAPILPNPADQEECLSEIVTRIWYKIGLFDASRGSWNAWLTALTRNAALNYRRKEQALLKNRHPQDIPEDMASAAPTPEEKMLQAEREDALNRALQKLSPREWTLFYRKYYYLQPTVQIAAELGMTERAVEGRLYRLKKKLQKLLGGEWHA